MRVPPDDPAYTLRRVWLTQEEEEGYYYGFSNEGLWPLCHLAYVRPAFRESDWQYLSCRQSEVRRRGRARGAREQPGRADPGLSLRAAPATHPRDASPRRPSCCSGTSRGPTPRRSECARGSDEMLLHLLSADILGFHTRYHCQNFLATVDRFVECQIDHEHMTVTLQGRVCQVVPVPDLDRVAAPAARPAAPSQPCPDRRAPPLRHQRRCVTGTGCRTMGLHERHRRDDSRRWKFSWRRGRICAAR